MIDELDPDVATALYRYLTAYHEKDLQDLDKQTPLFVSLSRNSYGNALSLVSLSAICKSRLGESSIHTLRHTFAHEMETQGATVTEIQQRLGHSSLATTGRYLSKLASPENKHVSKLSKAFGFNRKDKQ